MVLQKINLHTNKRDELYTDSIDAFAVQKIVQINENELLIVAEYKLLIVSTDLKIEAEFLGYPDINYSFKDALPLADGNFIVAGQTGTGAKWKAFIGKIERDKFTVKNEGK